MGFLEFLSNVLDVPKKRLTAILAISFLLIYFIYGFLFVSGFFDKYDSLSDDVTISNVYLCKMVENSCQSIKSDNISSEAWKTLWVCADYFSSENSPLSIFWHAGKRGNVFGVYYDDVPPGQTEICYSLFDAVDINNKYFESEPNLISGSYLPNGDYLVVFKQGREELSVFEFTVGN